MKTRFDFFLMEEAGKEGSSGGGSSLEDRLNSPDGTFTDPFNNDGDGGGNNDGNGSEGKKPAFTTNSMWSMFKDQEGFVMPENITQENEFDLMKPFLEKKLNVQPKINLHPLAASIQDIVTKQPDISVEDIINRINGENIDPMTMSNDDLVRMDFIDKFGRYDETNNPDGLSDEDIDAELTSMSKIQKLTIARTVREGLIAKRDEQLKSFSNLGQQTFEQGIQQANEAIEKSIPILLAELGKKTDIYGINISQPDYVKYLEEYKTFLQPDPKTGQSKIAEWLSNDQNIFKAWLLQVKIGEENMKEIITEAKESSKKKLFESLLLTPGIPGGQGHQPDLTDPNSKDVKDRLNSPDGSYK